VLVVVTVTAVFAFFSPRTEIIKSNLIGEGCGKTELKDVKCELSIGEKKLTLRECSADSLCNQSEYKLGKRKDNQQYVALSSEAFGKSVEILAIDIDSMSQIESKTAFYTEVKDSCKNKKVYTQDCFYFPVSEEQIKDISNENQKYNQLLQENNLN